MTYFPLRICGESYLDNPQGFLLTNCGILVYRGHNAFPRCYFYRNSLQVAERIRTPLVRILALQCTFVNKKIDVELYK